MKKPNSSRRHFIKAASVVTAGTIASSHFYGSPAILKKRFGSSSWVEGVQIGVITYSFRSMPDQSAEATLQYILDSGISHIELMGDPVESFAGKPESPVDRRAMWGLMRKERSGEGLSDSEVAELNEMREAAEAYNLQVAEWRKKVDMKKFKQVRKMYNDAGVSIYGFKPSAFGRNNTDAEIDYGFKAAKALGASHVTLEHPSDDAHTLKLGTMAKKHGLYVAYHGHEQQTPTFWDKALEQSKFNAMNPDMGHYVAAGNDKPLELLSKYQNRIMSVHIKDRQTPANGKKNLLWGTGDTPITEILQLMKTSSATYPATIELEYDIPEGSDAVKEVQRCFDYCRKSLM